MLNLETINKIANRIKDSQRFEERWISHRIYFFDDQLTVERYNGLYRIEFRGQTLGHLHNDDENKSLLDIIYHAIDDKKKELKEKAFREL